MLRPGANCWRIEQADRAALIVDAADYFSLARKAMLKAKSQILLIGWDFDTRIFLDEPSGDGCPVKLGPLLSWIAKNHPQVSIHILKWDLGAVKLLGRGTTVLRLLRWAMTKQISFKLDGAHPLGGSHHHKIVVVDDRLAFCGGIDMTASRWDTRGHLDGDKRRRRPTTGRRYDPWHDATMALDGAAARAIGELARERWSIAGGAPISPPQAVSDPWPQELKPAFHDVEIAIARTRAAHKNSCALREIEALFVEMIEGARRFVYAESQFFASRVIGEAIGKRLAEPDGPEFVVVNPRVAEGWVYDEVMSPARARLMLQLKKLDRHGRFRLYTPVTAAGEDIYVHSKITIVDDSLLRVGSANMNNRSMGLDSECDVMIDSRRESNSGADKQIAALRNDLLAEHLGVAVEQVAASFAATGSLIKTIEELRGVGRTLMPFEPEEPNAVEKAIADSELLDPESAGTSAEPPPRPGLLRGLRSRWQTRRRAA